MKNTSSYIYCVWVVFCLLAPKTAISQSAKTDQKNQSMRALLSQISISAIALDSTHFSKEEITAKWIGQPACTQQEIDAAEKRLHISLPKDYIEFLKITNGFKYANGTDPSFCAVQDIDYLAKLDPELIEIWNRTGNNETADKMKKALLVGGLSEEQYFFLVPTKNGQWEYWAFASWAPGEAVYLSLKAYFESVLEITNSFLVDKKNTR